MIETQPNPLYDNKKQILDYVENRRLEQGITTDLQEVSIREIMGLVNNSHVKRAIKILNNDYGIKFDYSNLVELENSLYHTHQRIQELREIEEFRKLQENKVLYDWDKIKDNFEKRKVFQKFPNFRWRKFVKYIKEPPLQIGKVKIDPFLAKKFIIGIIQMIGNNMDLWIFNTGSEGSGKSCFSSQQLLFLYTFLRYVGLIDYDYNIENFVRTNLGDLLGYLNSLKNDSYFNISILDEAEDLDRLNFREEENKTFKSMMRRSRKNLNIVIFNTPQIGEIDTSLTLARVNFVFQCKMGYDSSTSLLKKGMANMYIIPRVDYIYSAYYNKIFSRIDIKTAFAKQFEKKSDYYKDLPKQYIIKIINFNEAWGFDEDKYDKLIKKENKEKFVRTGIKITPRQGYFLLCCLPPPRKLFNYKDNKPVIAKSKHFFAFKKLQEKIRMLFKNNPDLIKSYEEDFKKFDKKLKVVDDDIQE